MAHRTVTWLLVCLLITASLPAGAAWAQSRREQQQAQQQIQAHNAARADRGGRISFLRIGPDV